MPHALYFVKIYSGMHEKIRSEEKRFKIIGLLTTKKLRKWERLSDILRKKIHLINVKIIKRQNGSNQKGKQKLNSKPLTG